MPIANGIDDGLVIYPTREDRCMRPRFTFQSRVMATVLAALSLSLLPLSPSLAAAAPSRAAILVRVAGVPAGASEILVEAQSPLPHMGVPRRLDLYLLAARPATSASTTVTVPPSMLLSEIAAA